MVLGGGFGVWCGDEGGGGWCMGRWGVTGCAGFWSGVHGGTFDVVNAPYSADPPPPPPSLPPQKKKILPFGISGFPKLRKTQAGVHKNLTQETPKTSFGDVSVHRCRKSKKKNWREFPPGGYPTESRGVRIYMRLSLSINFGPKSLSIDKLLGQKFIDR